MPIQYPEYVIFQYHEEDNNLAPVGVANSWEEVLTFYETNDLGRRAGCPMVSYRFSPENLNPGAAVPVPTDPSGPQIVEKNLKEPVEVNAKNNNPAVVSNPHDS